MLTVSQLLARGLKHHRAGQIAEADMIYRQIVHDWPDQPDALHLLGVLSGQRGQHEAAANMIADAIRMRPSRGDYHASLANILYAQQKLREGAERYRRAMYHAYLKRVPVSLIDILDFAERPPVDMPGRPEEVGLYKSQTLQDLFLDRWVFRGLTGGAFADIGAHDGVTYSNSWFFETQRGWRGICVEPNPSVFKRLKATRTARVFDCCVAAAPGRVEYQKISGYSEMLSGIAERYDPEHKQRIADELRQYGGSSETIAVDARTFADIAEEAGISEFSYVSVDIEGGELDLLRSMDFEKFFIHALTVECNERNAEAMTWTMRMNDFEMIKSIGPDLLFLNKESAYFPAYDALRSA